jgi:hypothetical protein
VNDPPSHETPDELLATTKALTRRVRDAQRATWFPLVVLGAVTLAAIPVLRYGHKTATCTTRSAGAAVRGCLIYPDAWFVYWPIALVLSYAAIAAFYVYRSRRRGVGTPIGPYIVGGVIVTVLVTAASVWFVHDPFGATQERLFRVHSVPHLFTGPLYAVGLGLLVLAWVERSKALLLFALAYLAVVAVPVTFGWTMAPPWFSLPRLVIAGGLLLLAAAGFAVAEKSQRGS